MAKRASTSRASSGVVSRVGRIGTRRKPAGALHGARQASIVETHEGFFWRDPESERLVGPFRSMRAAMLDRDSPGTGDEDLLEALDGNAVLDAESEIGIDDFIDPDTGEPTHGYEPHVRDDH
jgi:hypothetical protein